MEILIIGGILALALLFVPGWLGRSREAMLTQYTALEKRFYFTRKRYPSKWGRGIGDRYSLSGDFQGYPITLYDHFRGEGSAKQVWTSLSLEMLFAGEMEALIEPSIGDDAARFPKGESLEDVGATAGAFSVFSNSVGIGRDLLDAELNERFERFKGRGSFRLSKGFFEYRESGRMIDETKRLAFQDALAILAALGDRLSELQAPEDSD